MANASDRPRPLPVRAAAARLLVELQGGRSLAELIPRYRERVSERDSALLGELAHGICRWHGRLQAIAGLLLQKPLRARDADMQALILLGLYQLAYLRIKPHAAVAETVQAVRVLKKPRMAGLVNATLRRFLREREALCERVDRDEAVRLSCPDWLLGRLRAAWPDDWQAIAEAGNGRSPMTLRVNRLRIQRDAYQQQLQQAGIDTEPLAAAPQALRLARPVDVDALPGFADGLCSVQDAGAQLAAPLLDCQPGQRVLDACAAPGGKSCHLLELYPDIQLTALDIDTQRLARVAQNLERLRLSAELATGDAASPLGDWAGRRYDRILLDVPCSASGVIRRHPDIKLLRRDADIAELVRRQRQILDAVWPLLAPGGKLLYATCSILPDENEHQLMRFLEQQPDAAAAPMKADWGQARAIGRQTLPDASMDGFYYALLQKRVETNT